MSPPVGEKPKFLPFFGLRHLVVSPLGSSLRKLDKLHNYKHFPIQWYENCFCNPTPSWRNRAHNLWRSKAWRTNRQTDKQTDKNSTFLTTPAAGKMHQTWHGDTGPRARSCTSKTFDQISVNISVVGPVPLPLHRLGWNLAQRRGPFVPWSVPTCRPCGAKNLKIGQSASE